MASNTIKINVGSLGCLGGEGNLRDVSIHDSTCSCEGCLEKRLADREFTIGADPFSQSTKKNYGFNDGDIGTERDLSELDSDSDDEGSVSDIFDINNDPPASNDDGYCDDGDDEEDTYSVFSPKSYTIDEQNELNGDLDDIEEEDTPPVKIEDTINDASIEASKKDGQLSEDCNERIEHEGHDSVQLRTLNKSLDEERLKAETFWKDQVQQYETKITHMFKQMSKYAEGLRAAKRHMDYDAFEIHRVRDLVMDKTAEVNQKDEKIYQITDAMVLMEHHYQFREKRKQRAFNEIAKQLDAQMAVSEELRKELKVTRERLNTFTRRSVPRRTKRLRKHVAQYDDGDEESSVTLGSNSDTEYEDDDKRTSKLVRSMDFDD